MTAPVRPLIASPTPYKCGAGRTPCRRPARLYPAGWLCDQHAPAQQNGHPEPSDPKEQT